MIYKCKNQSHQHSCFWTIVPKKTQFRKISATYRGFVLLRRFLNTTRVPNLAHSTENKPGRSTCVTASELSLCIPTLPLCHCETASELSLCITVSLQHCVIASELSLCITTTLRHHGKALPLPSPCNSPSEIELLLENRFPSSY